MDSGLLAPFCCSADFVVRVAARSRNDYREDEAVDADYKVHPTVRRTFAAELCLSRNS